MKWFDRIKAKLKGKEVSEVEEYCLKDREVEKLSESFVSRDEKYIASLGNGYIMNFLANKSAKKGFAFITDKRVYFKGSCLSGTGKNLVKTSEERTVDVKNITGSGFIYQRYWGILLSLFVSLIASLGGVAGAVMNCENTLGDEIRHIKGNKADKEILEFVSDELDEIELYGDISWYGDDEFEGEIVAAFGYDDKIHLIDIEFDDGDADVRLKRSGVEIREWKNGDWDIVDLRRHSALWGDWYFYDWISNLDESDLEDFYDTNDENGFRRYLFSEVVDYTIDDLDESNIPSVIGYALLSLVSMALFLSLTVICCIGIKNYLLKRKTLFRIEYAGGCIAFNVSFYAKAEIDDFQKQLRRAKDMAEESTTVKAVTMETPVEVPAQNHNADDLRKYAELLKDGLITQEEYDAMKKKVLGL